MWDEIFRDMHLDPKVYEGLMLSPIRFIYYYFTDLLSIATIFPI